MTRVTFVCLAGAAWLSTPDVHACGGFFCNSARPVDQVGEKILFIVDDGAGTVEAHIQIQYEGEAEDFSWVVPVPSIPALDVGTDEVFTRLLGATTPRYEILRSSVGSCGMHCPEPPDCYGGDADGDADADTDSDTGFDGGGVVVEGSGVVGPFETVTLSSDDPDALATWLADNGYDLPATAEPILAAYVAAGDHFVGLKLRKEADTGDLRPIVLRLTERTPCIPIRLTAIAAQPNLPIFAWVLGTERAVSTNYLDVVPNDVVVHVASYGRAVADAIDEAGGRAFVTEYAGTSGPAEEALDPSPYDTDALRNLSDPSLMIGAIVSQGFGVSTLLFELLARFMPPPEGVDPIDFYNCPSCYVGDEYSFDHVGLANALEEELVRPLRGVHDAFLRFPELTRLYTEISPAEMTEDPVFAFNPDLPGVDLVHTSRATHDCRDTRDPSDDYSVARTGGGHRFCWHEVRPYPDFGSSDSVSYRPPAAIPALERAVLSSERGPGEVVVDNGDAIDALLSCDIPAIEIDGPCPKVRVCPSPEDIDGDGVRDDQRGVARTYPRRVAGGGGCSAVPAGEAPAAIAAAALLLLGLVERRLR